MSKEKSERSKIINRRPSRNDGMANDHAIISRREKVRETYVSPVQQKTEAPKPPPRRK